VPARRFFVEGVRATGEIVTITGSDAHKIARVLRLSDGDSIEAVDSAGTLFSATIAIDGHDVRARIGDILQTGEVSPELQVDLAQAVPKGAKMDFIVEKATELGAGAILPFFSDRTVAGDVGGAKLERWRRLARSAAQQCGRRTVPDVEAPAAFSELLDRFTGYDAVLFPWELAPREPVIERLRDAMAGAQRILAVIGPEGGFSHDEAAAAAARGARWLWLGPRILRTETAGMALLAVVAALTY
jgi:16S rRNA (uracil1498-N3)-methyltransferase